MNWTGILDQFLHNVKEPLLFHTGIFLLIFSLFLIGYSFVYQQNQVRNIFIILFGFYFYYKASGAFLLLLILTISADYFFSMLMEQQRDPFLRKIVLTLGILFSLSFLLVFKYTDFFFENLSFFTAEAITPLHLILPIGISFYTFQSISYLVDIYKRKIERPMYSDYLMYMSFFPHLVAGPIVRARDFLPQLKTTVTVTRENLNEAFWLITKGLVKKAIIADFIAQYSDAIFAQPEGFSGTENLMGSLCYTLQIFCDFSGYTDMAIGVALLMGFRLGLNFDSPYKSLNITEFWRKWHISLSSWLRDYIYIPLGGNQKGFVLQLLFLLTTMLIGGFWHGPSWKFVFWGAGHGLLLIIHKLFTNLWPDTSAKTKYEHHTKIAVAAPEGGKSVLEWVLAPLFWFLTFASVSLLWIPFRADTMDTAWTVYTKIFSGFDIEIFLAALSRNELLYIFLLFGFVATMAPQIVKDKLRKGYDWLPFLGKLVILALLVQMFIQVRSETVQPFIYFEF